MKKLIPLTILFISLLNVHNSLSQVNLSSEVGVTFGVASYQSDFGERYDFPSANASTFAFGLSYYLKFFGKQYSWRTGSTYFSEHFKVKAEFNYVFNTNIKHEGSYAQGDGAIAVKLRRMTGEIKMYNLGANLEYYFFELEDYASFYRAENQLNPFISVGLHYSFYDPNIYVDGVSLEGKPEPYTDLIPKWQEGAIYLDKGAVFGASAGAGIRYSIASVDLLFEGRWQHFFSDKVDGLDDTSELSGSKYNDTMVFINAGVVYVFGKN